MACSLVKTRTFEEHHGQVKEEDNTGVRCDADDGRKRLTEKGTNISSVERKDSFTKTVRGKGIKSHPAGRLSPHLHGSHRKSQEVENPP